LAVDSLKSRTIFLIVDPPPRQVVLNRSQPGAVLRPQIAITLVVVQPLVLQGPRVRLPQALLPKHSRTNRKKLDRYFPERRRVWKILSKTGSLICLQHLFLSQKE
jgi:hypothetical protein